METCACFKLKFAIAFYKNKDHTNDASLQIKLLEIVHYTMFKMSPLW